MIDNADIVELGEIINPNMFLEFVEEADKLEIVIHKYGQSLVNYNFPYWIQYNNEGNTQGTISFTRNTYSHPILRKMVDMIIEKLVPFFPKETPPNPLRVHLVKTTGSLPIHKDENGRTTCINIGLKNSSGAITKISTDGHYGMMLVNSKSIVVQDGYGYLMNTNQWHSVTSTNNFDRYLITYSFDTTFSDTIKFLQISENK